VVPRRSPRKSAAPRDRAVPRTCAVWRSCIARALLPSAPLEMAVTFASVHPLGMNGFIPWG
jgi:hypothetical protein